MRFSEIRPEYEEQMLGWIAPVGRDAFVGRRVLDAGCGKGRHLRLASAFGAKEVIGIDLGPAVDAAAENTADLDKVHVVQGDLTHPPLRPASIDLIYSIGVLHHLGEPEAGFRALAPLLVPGGRFVVWLYAREGNGWVLTLVDPARRLKPAAAAAGERTRARPHGAALDCAAPALRAGANAPEARAALPYSSYLRDLVPFPFREVHSIAFDQFLAPVAHYMERPRVARCFAEGGITLDSLRWHHANSWAASGTRSEAR